MFSKIKQVVAYLVWIFSTKHIDHGLHQQGLGSDMYLPSDPTAMWIIMALPPESNLDKQVIVDNHPYLLFVGCMVNQSKYIMQGFQMFSQ